RRGVLEYRPAAGRQPEHQDALGPSKAARSRGVVPSIGGLGWSSSRYSMMASDSVRWLPSSSSRTGRPPSGFFLRNPGERFSPVTMLTDSHGMSMPFSARYTRSFFGFGAPTKS